MIDMTKQYRYYNGTAARILCTDRPFAGNLVVLSMRPNGAIVQSTIEGKSQCRDGEYDLVEVWEPKEGTPAWLGLQLVLIYEVSDKGIYIKTEEDSFYTSICHLREFTGTLPEAFKGL